MHQSARKNDTGNNIAVAARQANVAGYQKSLAPGPRQELVRYVQDGYGMSERSSLLERSTHGDPPRTPLYATATSGVPSILHTSCSLEK